MPDTVLTPPPAAGKTKSRIEGTSHYLGLISTSIGICGALGTLFVGAVTYFYVGDVEVNAGQPVDALIVKVYDNKGHEAVYHSPRFQLMPGDYHLEISSGAGKPAHKEISVKFREKTAVEVESLDAIAGGAQGKKKPWWRFWR